MRRQEPLSAPTAEELQQDGWHMDYELKDPHVQGGGPHYVIDPGDGAILAKQYEQ